MLYIYCIGQKRKKEHFQVQRVKKIEKKKRTYPIDVQDKKK